MKIWVWLVIATVVIVGVVFAFQFRTGNVVVVGLAHEFKVGENLEASLIVIIEKGDSISANAPVTISLIKDRLIVDQRVILFRDFVDLSNNPVAPVVREEGSFYETPGRYTVKFDSFIDYVFEEQGEYGITMTIPSEGFSVKKEFKVD